MAELARSGCAWRSRNSHCSEGEPRLRAIALALGVLLASFVAGCSSPQPRQDGAVPDVARQDSAGSDAVSRDAVQVQPDLPAADAKPADLRPPDTVIAADAAPCPAPGFFPTATTCAGQCPSCPADPDQDGLSGVMDPSPNTCNRYLEGDDLARDPALSSKWTITGGPLNWKCGQLEMPPGSKLSLANTSVLTTSTFLAQLRFSFSGGTGDWNVGMGVGFSGNEDQNYCEAWASTAKTAGKPGFRVVSPCASTWSPSSIVVSPGVEYILETWSDGKMVECRLYSGSGSFLHGLAAMDCGGGTDKGFKLFATNANAVVRQVRIFQY